MSEEIHERYQKRIAELTEELDAAIAKVDRLRAELNEANYWRHNYADSVKIISSERDSAIARAEQAEAAGELYLTELRRYQGIEADKLGMDACKQIGRLHGELDDARTTHSKAVELLEKCDYIMYSIGHLKPGELDEIRIALYNFLTKNKEAKK